MIGGKEVKKRQKKKRKNPANIASLEDPLDQLGFGIVAYNQLMRKFTWLFLFFSILMAPAIYFNGLGTGYAFVPAAMKSYEGHTLGNLGYSSVQCQTIPIVVGKLSLSCPFGVIGEFYDYGVNSEDDGGAPGSCMTTEFNEACKPDNQKFSDILEDAKGKQEVTVTLSQDDIYFANSDRDTYGECVGSQKNVQLFA